MVEQLAKKKNIANHKSNHTATDTCCSSNDNKHFERQQPKSNELVSQNNQVGKPIYADYKSRKLDFCHFCGEQYNVGARIPRILVHCGHTFCTECLATCLFRNFRVRCPICRKLVKNLETPERLPLNINILYEVVERDPLLSSIDFDEVSPEGGMTDDKLCIPHNMRIMHFYCSNHRTIFCRECIQVDHTDEKCFVVDLYEIEKMRKLQSQNIALNKSQLGKRKDGATVSCVVVEAFKHHVPVPAQSKPLQQAKKVLQQQLQPQNLKDPFDYASAQAQLQIYDYGNEGEMTDDARTNEELYLQKGGLPLTDAERRAALEAYDEKLYIRDQLNQQRLLQQQMAALRQGTNTNQLTSSAMFFNEEGQIDDDEQSEEDEEEEEEGQFLAQSNGNQRLTMEDISNYKEMMRAQMIAANSKHTYQQEYYEDDNEGEEEY